MIVAGERRWRASMMAGKPTLTCVVVEAEQAESEILHDQLVENCLRSNLQPIEQAEAFHALMDAKGWNAARLAEERCTSATSTVFKALALLDLPGKCARRSRPGRSRRRPPTSCPAWRSRGPEGPWPTGSSRGAVARRGGDRRPRHDRPGRRRPARRPAGDQHRPPPQADPHRPGRRPPRDRDRRPQGRHQGRPGRGPRPPGGTLRHRRRRLTRIDIPTHGPASDPSPGSDAGPPHAHRGTATGPVETSSL